MSFFSFFKCSTGNEVVKYSENKKIIKDSQSIKYGDNGSLTIPKKKINVNENLNPYKDIPIFNHGEIDADVLKPEPRRILTDIFFNNQEKIDSIESASTKTNSTFEANLSNKFSTDSESSGFNSLTNYTKDLT